MNKQHAPSTKMRAKLRRLANKYSTVASASGLNNINKPGKAKTNPDVPDRSTYWKNLPEGTGYYEPISELEEVTGNRNESVFVATNNSAYSETVHDESTAATSVSDGPKSTIGITDRSTTLTADWQEDSNNETVPANKSVTETSVTGSENKAKSDVSRKRRFDVGSNEIPTFPVEPPPGKTHFTMYQPAVGAENWNINRLAGYDSGLEGQRRISQNERYSKVGRDPPLWVPVEPIEGQPVLREPANKATKLEPYEPIPPLARNDKGWYRKTETEPVTVNGTAVSVRRRPEAKEGGPPQAPTELGKITSALEREWIRDAGVTRVSFRNVTESNRALQPNITADKPIPKVLHGLFKSVVDNRTGTDLRTKGNDKPRSNEETIETNSNHTTKNCVPASWRNVRLIQDALSGGYYVIQAKTGGNCTGHNQANPAREQKQTTKEENAATKPEKQHISTTIFNQEQRSIPRGPGSSLTADISSSTHPNGKLVDNAINFPEHPHDGKSIDKSFSKDSRRDPASSADSSSGPITPEADTDSDNQFAANLMKYYLAGRHPQARADQDSISKDAALGLNSDYRDLLVNQEETDLNLDLEEDAMIPPDILPSIQDGDFWHSLPPPDQRGIPWNMENVDDVMEEGFQIVDRSDRHDVPGRIFAELF